MNFMFVYFFLTNTNYAWDTKDENYIYQALSWENYFLGLQPYNDQDSGEEINLVKLFWK